MSVRIKLVLCALYVVALIAYGLFVEFREPPTVPDFIAVSRAIGSGVGRLLISAVIPLLIWGGAKIISRPIGFPVILWVALGIGLTYFAELGRQADRQLQIDQFVRTTEFGEQERADFRSGALKTCMDNQRKNEINRTAGVTEQQINRFCVCYADYLTKAVTPEEFRDGISKGTVPDSVIPKLAQAGPYCSKALTEN